MSLRTSLEDLDGGYTTPRLLLPTVAFSARRSRSQSMMYASATGSQAATPNRYTTLTTSDTHSEGVEGSEIGDVASVTTADGITRLRSVDQALSRFQEQINDTTIEEAADEVRKISAAKEQRRLTKEQETAIRRRQEREDRIRRKQEEEQVADEQRLKELAEREQEEEEEAKRRQKEVDDDEQRRAFEEEAYLREEDERTRAEESEHIRVQAEQKEQLEAEEQQREAVRKAKAEKEKRTREKALRLQKQEEEEQKQLEMERAEEEAAERLKAQELENMLKLQKEESLRTATQEAELKQKAYEQQLAAERELERQKLQEDLKQLAIKKEAIRAAQERAATERDTFLAQFKSYASLIEEDQRARWANLVSYMKDILTVESQRVEAEQENIRLELIRQQEEADRVRAEEELKREEAALEEKLQEEAARKVFVEQEKVRQQQLEKQLAAEREDEEEQLRAERRKLAEEKEAARVAQVHIAERDTFLAQHASCVAIIESDQRARWANLVSYMKDLLDEEDLRSTTELLELQRQHEASLRVAEISRLEAKRVTEEDEHAYRTDYHNARRREEVSALRIQMASEQREHSITMEAAEREALEESMRREERRKEGLEAIHQQEILRANELKQHLVALEEIQQRRLKADEEARTALEARERECEAIVQSVHAVAEASARDHETYLTWENEVAQKILAAHSEQVLQEQLKEKLQVAHVVGETINKERQYMFETARELHGIEDARAALFARQSKLRQAKEQLIEELHSTLIANAMHNRLTGSPERLSSPRRRLLLSPTPDSARNNYEPEISTPEREMFIQGRVQGLSQKSGKVNDRKVRGSVLSPAPFASHSIPAVRKFSTSDISTLPEDELMKHPIIEKALQKFQAKQDHHLDGHSPTPKRPIAAINSQSDVTVRNEKFFADATTSMLTISGRRKVAESQPQQQIGGEVEYVPTAPPVITARGAAARLRIPLSVLLRYNAYLEGPDAIIPATGVVMLPNREQSLTATSIALRHGIALEALLDASPLIVPSSGDTMVSATNQVAVAASHLAETLAPADECPVQLISNSQHVKHSYQHVSDLSSRQFASNSDPSAMERKESRLEEDFVCDDEETGQVEPTFDSTRSTSIANLPQNFDFSAAQSLPLTTVHVQPEQVASKRQLDTLTGEQLERIKKAGSGVVPRNGHVAVRFSPFVLKKRHISVTADGNNILVSAATLGQKIRGVPPEVIPANSISVMVETLEFDESRLQLLTPKPKGAVAALEDVVSSAFGSAKSRHYIVKDANGNLALIGCSFFLLRKTDKALVEFVCADAAERMEWLAWFVFILKALPIESALLLNTNTSETLKSSTTNHSSRIAQSPTASPIPIRGAEASPHPPDRGGHYPRDTRILSNDYIPLYSNKHTATPQSLVHKPMLNLSPIPRDAAARTQALHASLPPPAYPKAMVPVYATNSSPSPKVVFDRYSLIKHSSLPSGAVYGRLILVTGGSSNLFLQLRREIEGQRGVSDGVDLLLHVSTLAGFMPAKGDSHSFLVWPKQIQGTPFATTSMLSIADGNNHLSNSIISSDPATGNYATMLRECRVLAEPFTITAMSTEDLVSLARCLKM